MTDADDPRSTPWRHLIAKGAFESALIVFSVLLALTVDNWRDARARTRSLNEARTALVQELRFNRELLASDPYLPHHIRLHGIYDSMESSGKTDQLGALFQNGVHMAPLRDAAWRSFSATDVANDLPFAQRALLAGLYAVQTNLEYTHRALVTTASQPTALRDNPVFLRDFVRCIDLFLTDIVYAETRMLKGYDEALAELTKPVG